jgi:hypothetical protein
MDNQLAVSTLLEEWQAIKFELEEYFRDRNQQGAKVLMDQGINLFIRFLHLTNEDISITRESIPFNEIPYKPVNVEERLSFIQSRPNLFHSFRQLSELMVEQEKQYVKKNITKKSSRPNA